MSPRAWSYLLVAIALGVAAAIVDAQSRAVTLAIGRFGGTDQEIQECWFSIGGAMLALHPKGEYCPIAREMIGRTGTLVFVPD